MDAHSRDENVLPATTVLGTSIVASNMGSYCMNLIKMYAINR